MGAAKAMASLRICASSPEPTLLDDAISTEVSCSCTYVLEKRITPMYNTIFKV